MLKTRLIAVAAVLAPILFLMWLDDRSAVPGVWMLPLILLAGIVGSNEIVELMRGGGLSVNRRPVIVGSSLLLATACVEIFYSFPVGCPIGPWGAIAAAIVGATWVILLDEMWRFVEPGGVVQRMALELFSVIYVALPICFLVRLRLLHANRLGLLAVISVIFVVKVADSGAYFAGKSFGKHKMAPVLSPKKTWAGAAGAVVSAMLAATFFLKWLIPSMVDSGPVDSGMIVDETGVRLVAALGYGAILSVVGMIGDLGESLIKRDLQQKDSASWLPGLGGVLDMLDSLLLAAPVGYLYWASGILG